jgi:hypothetical protein
MGKNQSINSDFWRDEWTSKLDPTEKLLFLYLITCPDSNIAGVYQLPMRNMALETGIDESMIKIIFNRFKKEKKILYKSGWVVIKNRKDFNKLDNPSIQAGITTLLNNAPDFAIAFIDLDQSGTRVVPLCRTSDIDINKDIDKDSTNTLNGISKKKSKNGKEKTIEEIEAFKAGQRLCTFYKAKYEEIIGLPYTIKWEQDNPKIEKLLKDDKEEEIQTLIEWFLGQEKHPLNKWWEDVSKTIASFCGNVSDIRLKLMKGAKK